MKDTQEGTKMSDLREQTALELMKILGASFEIPMNSKRAKELLDVLRKNEDKESPAWRTRLVESLVAVIDLESRLASLTAAFPRHPLILGGVNETHDPIHASGSNDGTRADKEGRTPSREPEGGRND